MRVDTNTQGHRQWFYFSMKNEKKCTVKLHIYRFKKQFSLFQRGMKPYVRSRKSGQEWKQGGENVFYHY
jgi:cytosolic carboxypeptidase protein 2/3